MQKLTTLSKLMLCVIAIGSIFGAARTYGTSGRPRIALERTTPKVSSLGLGTGSSLGAALPAASGPTAVTALKALPPIGDRPVRVALSQWPGHMALLVGAGGLKTMPGSIASEEGLKVEIQFIEDAPSKNQALQNGAVDFVWQTVDELPISLGGYRAAGVDVRAFMQIDWSRGGDACVASREVRTVESVYG